MKLLADRIAVNGRTSLKVWAVDDEGERLPYAEKVSDLEARATRTKMAKGMVEDLGCTDEAAKAAVQQLYLDIQRQIDDAEDMPPETPPEMVTTARLDGLVEIVSAADDGRPVYLFVNESELAAADYHDEGGVRYVPPELLHFPYLLCREEAVRAAYASDTDEALFAALLTWHMDASRLPGEGHYQLTALFVLLTWLADKMDYAPYLALESRDPERGKTRWGQGVAWVSYRGIHTETLQEANLFRWSDSLQATLFFDVRDLWRKAEKRGAEDILLSRFQRNGAKVARVLDPQAGPFKGVTYFDCYGPTILAINESLREPLLSRTLGIVPPEAAGKYGTLREIDALPLKARCAAFRARHLLDPIPNVDKPANGRLGDIMQPLAQVAAIVGGDLPDVFPSIVEEFRSARQSTRSQSYEAHLVNAVVAAVEAGHLVEDVVPNSAVLDILNAGLAEDKRINSQQLGRRLQALGFAHGRTIDAARQHGRIVDPEQLQALKVKYGLLEGVEITAGHDSDDSDDSDALDTTHARPSDRPSDRVEPSESVRVPQLGQPLGQDCATPGRPSGPSGPSDVQSSEHTPEETPNCVFCQKPAPSGYPVSGGGVRHNGCKE